MSGANEHRMAVDDMGVTAVSEGKRRERYCLIDGIRGITILSMILYHGSWDLIYLGYGLSFAFLQTFGMKVWQLSICVSFILISGFCMHFGRHPARHGLVILGCGAVVSLVTALVIPSALDLFGVLWMLGFAALVTAVLHRWGRKLTPLPAALLSVLSLALFFFCYHARDHYLGFPGHPLIALPGVLYSGYVSTFFGFPFPGFFSTDYFPIIPWIFLFLTGYFLHPVIRKNEAVMGFLRHEIPLFSALGRHSLLIYMLHQPILYGILYGLLLLRG